mmetsp:Transcript_20462/g.32551  ORF Transcript_20462/g.32551 Transcript_20462/m.32551 type:complete len:206 (+) Transcript_20462:112-729(+)
MLSELNTKNRKYCHFLIKCHPLCAGSPVSFPSHFPSSICLTVPVSVIAAISISTSLQSTEIRAQWHVVRIIVDIRTSMPSDTACSGTKIFAFLSALHFKSSDVFQCGDDHVLKTRIQENLQSDLIHFVVAADCAPFDVCKQFIPSHFEFGEQEIRAVLLGQFRLDPHVFDVDTHRLCRLHVEPGSLYHAQCVHAETEIRSKRQYF